MPVEFVILIEKKRYAGGSVWQCSSCKETFDRVGGVPTHCFRCGKFASETKRLLA